MTVHGRFAIKSFMQNCDDAISENIPFLMNMFIDLDHNQYS